MDGDLKQTLIEAQDEISSLKTVLSEKNSTLHHLISTHETLKTASKAEISKLESEKRDLISALDEANLNKEEKERKIGSYQQEIQRLRSLLEESQKKCKQTEELAQKGKEFRKREELLVSFEEQSEKIQEKFKWKCEQFSHLEEAYKKSQQEMKDFKRETEKEKSEFVKKIGELEINLDSKSRFLEDLKSRFEMCNQALASEESKRKLLKAELHEIQERYDCMITDFEAARLAVESVTQQRDADVADLRGILADKSLQIKEIEFQKAQVEQENKELRDSLKELREIEIGGVEKSKKFRALEKKIRVRDSEIEGLKRELSDCLGKLNDKRVDCLDFEEGIVHEECDEKIRVRDLEIENLKKDLSDCLAKLNEKEISCANLEGIVRKECNEKIRVKDLEIEILKKDLDDCLVKFNNEKDGLVEKIRVKELEIDGLKKDLDDCLVKFNYEKDALIGKIKVKDFEIESLKKDLDDYLVKSNNEKVGLVEEIRVQEAEIVNLKRALNDNEKFVEKIRVQEAEIVNLKKDLNDNEKHDEKIRVQEAQIDTLKRDFDDCLARLGDKDKSVGILRKQLEMSYLKLEEEMFVKKQELAVALLVIKVNYKGHFEKCVKNARDKEIEDLVRQVRERGEVIERLKERETALVRENKSLSFEVKEREKVIEDIKQCEQSAKALERENERLRFEVRESENVIKECKEREEALEREKEGMIFELREREEVTEELKLCLEREKTENEKLICVVREREGVIEKLKEHEEREAVLERENEKLVSLVKEIEGEIEELKEHKEREEVLERENEKLVSLVEEREAEIEEIKLDNSSLEIQIQSLEEECKRFIQIENEMAKKLFEIKFKLDPLQGKCDEFSSELEENLYLLVEALGNSNSEIESMQLKLHEIISNYFLQEHEIQFKNCLISDMETEINSKEERTEKEKSENQNMEIKFLNEIDGLKQEKETLKLQMLDLNCGISSVFCADGEIKAIMENISQKVVKHEQEIIVKPNSPLRNKVFIPVFGIRSPLKENNFY